MKKYFLDLPFWSLEYPKAVHELAKGAGVDVEDVAKRDGIERIPVTNKVGWRFDLISMIIAVHDDPDYPGRSIIQLEDDSHLPVDMDRKKLQKKIGKFMIKNELQSDMITILDNQIEEEDE